MLVALMGGTARPASELARVAAIAPSTATSHLRRLVEQGLIVARPRGRHRYYELAGEHVAQAVEALVAAGMSAPARRAAADDSMAAARMCYAHLAGRLAVAFWARAVEQRWVRWSPEAVRLLPAGHDALARLDVPRGDTRALAGRPCLDWSERTPHVSGPLGTAVCASLFVHAWVARVPESRALRVTARGRTGLRALGVRWSP